jgi:hypothetical protein
MEEKEQGRRKPEKTENKRKRYDEKASVAPKISCNYSEKFCDAANLTLTDITKFHHLYWANKDSVSQKNFLIGFIDVQTPHRHRPNRGKNKNVSQPKKWTLTYYALTEKGKVAVCRESFLSILNVGRRKMENAATEKQEAGCAVPEKRGSARISQRMKDLQEKIISHIQSFKCRDRQWSRSDAPHRKYLPSDLNVRIMWTLFNEKNQDAATSPYHTYSYHKVSLRFHNT